MNYLRLAAAFCDAFWILWIRFPTMERTQKAAEIKRWSQHTLALMGVRVVATEGLEQFEASPQLLVANHVSWLDVLVIQSLFPSVFVAKSEVKAWPVIGAIAKACGVVFVERGSSSAARKMVDDVCSALENGHSVAGFPEGTSTEGSTVGVFHANLFQAAIARRVDVLPLALRYSDPLSGRLSQQAAFVGDIDFLTSLHQVMRAKSIQADVRLATRLSHQGQTRRTLAHLSQQAVQTQLAAFNAASA